MKINITPVSVYPGTANTLYVSPGTFSPPPNYYYELQDVQLVTPEVPAVGNPNDINYIPPISAVFSTTKLKSGYVSMTQAQWNNWTTNIDDTEYQLDCIAANLNLNKI